MVRIIAAEVQRVDIRGRYRLAASGERDRRGAVAVGLVVSVG